MKAPNCLVFRNQELRIGDLGISIKLDKRVDPNQPNYILKGYTNGFITKEVKLAYENGLMLSKNQLYENDKYALLVMFERASMRCKPLLNEDESTPLYDEII
jgi:hypothetical protein